MNHRIAIGTDHRGYQHKEHLKQTLADIEWIDVGAHDESRSDYPTFAHSVCAAMREDKADFGILLCGTGIGMAIAANRYNGIYAGLAWNTEVARLAREHDNVNVLVLPADYVSPEESAMMVCAWLQAQFLEGQYAVRFKMIDTK